MNRFRHPLAFLLVLTIAWLIWTAIAEPRWNRADEGQVVLLLDSSAGMGWGERFAEAVEALKREADQLPTDRRVAYLCGSDLRLILDHGDEGYLLTPRLKNVVPEACPSFMEGHLRALAAGAEGDGLQILLFGEAPRAEGGSRFAPGELVGGTRSIRTRART